MVEEKLRLRKKYIELIPTTKGECFKSPLEKGDSGGVFFRAIPHFHEDKFTTPCPMVGQASSPDIMMTRGTLVLHGGLFMPYIV